MLSSIHLSDGRPLCICEYPSDTESRTWLVFLPGSGAEFWDFSWSERRALLSAFSATTTPHLLMINKPGIDLDGNLQAHLYETSFRRQTRIADYCEVLAQVIPAGDSIFLVGFSEGAYLAPEIALLDSRVSALSLLSGGTRSWLDEEIYKCEDPRALRAVMKRVSQVYARPESVAAQWHKVSHATWTSYDTDATAIALKKLKRPVLALFGSQDRMIDVASALADLGAVTNSKVVTRVFAGVDHTLEHRWLSALRASGEFFNRYANKSSVAKSLSSRISPIPHSAI